MGVTSVVFVLFHFGFNLHVISIICISFSVPRMFSRQGGGGGGLLAIFLVILSLG